MKKIRTTNRRKEIVIALEGEPGIEEAGAFHHEVTGALVKTPGKPVIVDVTKATGLHITILQVLAAAMTRNRQISLRGQSNDAFQNGVEKTGLIRPEKYALHGDATLFWKTGVV